MTNYEKENSFYDFFSPSVFASSSSNSLINLSSSSLGKLLKTVFPSFRVSVATSTINAQVLSFEFKFQ